LGLSELSNLAFFATCPLEGVIIATLKMHTTTKKRDKKEQKKKRQ
jgi:hypothetical protein